MSTTTMARPTRPPARDPEGDPPGGGRCLGNRQRFAVMRGVLRLAGCGRTGTMAMRWCWRWTSPRWLRRPVAGAERG